MLRTVLAHLSDAARTAWGRLTTSLWTLLQQFLAAMVAWLLALEVAGHPNPFFAPVAAIVALNTALGERGRQAVQLLLGVLIGIAVGEVTLLTLGAGSVQLGGSMLLAMAVAKVVGGSNVTLAQAGIGTVLTVSVGDEQAGLDRIQDAVIGTGVALVFSQLIFSPDPVRMLRRAERTALRRLAAGLAQAADVLESDDEDDVPDAVSTLRELRDDVSEVARARRAGVKTVRRSPVWRWQREPAVGKDPDAGYLDLLSDSALMLVRVALDLPEERQRALAAPMRELADTVSDLAGRLSDHEARQVTVRRAIAVVEEVNELAPDGGRDGPLHLAVPLARLTARDLMVFAGVDRDEASAAVRSADAPRPREPVQERGARTAERIRGAIRRVAAGVDRRASRRRDADSDPDPESDSGG